MCKSIAFQNTETQAGNRNIKNKLYTAQQSGIINEITEEKASKLIPHGS